MTHDPLCLVSRPVRPSCECDFIAKVRADERERTIRDCIAAVERLTPWRTATFDEVGNALRELLEQP